MSTPAAKLGRGADAAALPSGARAAGIGAFAAGHLAVASVSRALALAGIAVYLRVLTEQEYAVYALALLNEQVLFILAGYALANAMGQFLTMARRGEVDEDEVVGTAVLGLLAVGAAAALAWQIVAAPVAALTLADGADAVAVSRLIGVSAAGGLVLNGALSVWIVGGRLAPFTVATLLQYAGAVLIGSGLIGVLDLGAVGAMAGWAAATWIAALFGLVWIARHHRLRFRRALLLDMLRYGRPLIAGALLMLGVQSIDRYAVRWMAGLQEAAIYSTVVLVAAGASAIIITAFKRVWTAVMWQSHGSPGEAELHRRVLGAYTAVQAAVLTLLLVYGDLPMRVLSGNDEKFAAAGPAIALVYLGFVLFGAWDVLSAGYFFAGQTRWYSISVAIAFAIEAPLTLALSRPFGLWGAAVGFLTGWWVFAVLSWRFGRRYFTVDHDWGRMLATVAVAGVLGGLALLARASGGAVGELLGLLVASGAVVACAVVGRLRDARDLLDLRLPSMPSPRVSRPAG